MRPTIILVILLVLNITLIYLDFTKKVNTLKLMVLYVISPTPDIVLNFISQTKDIDTNIRKIMVAVQENDRLKGKIQKLLFIKNQFDQVVQENARLARLIKLKDQYVYDTIPAKITSHDSSNWGKSIIINKGSYEEVEYDSPVVTFISNRVVLIGRTLEVGAHQTKVLLITDRLCSVPAKISSTNDQGLIQGKDLPLLLYDFLLINSTVKIGDEIVTSGIGEVFPEGLFIGVVKEVRNSPDLFFKQCTIEPFYRINTINEVLVIKKTKKTDKQ